MSLLMAPVVRARRLFAPRLEQVDPYIKGNLLAEARQLNRAGYSSAAVALARMAIERRLRELIAENPNLSMPRRFGLGIAVSALLNRKTIQDDEARCIDKWAAKANNVVHGAFVTRLQARGLVDRAARVLSMLEKKGGAA